MQRFVTTRGIRFHVNQRRGVGESLVFVHGLTDNAAAWDRVIAAIGPYYDVLSYDLRGHGLSDAPVIGYAVEDHAADLMDILDRLDLHNLTLIGHSLGAEVASAVAAMQPDRIADLVMVDPPWHLAALRESKTRREAMIRTWLSWLAQFRDMPIEAIVEVGRSTNPQWHETDLWNWARSRLEVRSQAIECLSSLRPDWKWTIEQLRHPTLLVIGDSRLGAAVSLDQANQAAAISRNLSVAHISGAGHGIYRDRFDDFMQVLRDFLRR